MFDLKQVGRLLRQDWPSATDLARELYDMMTSKDARRMAAPLSIEVPKGQTGIVISRESAKSPAATVRNQQTTINRANAARVPKVDVPDVRTEVAGQRAMNDPIEASFRRPQDGGDDGLSFPTSEDSRPTPGDFGARPGGDRPNSPNRQLRGPQVQSGPDFVPVRPSSGSAPISRKAYSNPVAEFSDEIRFSGITPVQFDVPPRVFNPVTDQYEEYNFDGRLTRIPLDTDDGDGAMWGQVVSGQGDTYQMNLFTDPDPDTKPTDFQSVKCVGLDSEEIIPVDTWIYPVIQTQSESAKWYALVPMWL